MLLVLAKVPVYQLSFPLPEFSEAYSFDNLWSAIEYV